SLFLILTSQAREGLRGIETVIVDEVHAVAGTKRGAHLALSLERIDELLGRPAQRIGLSATVRPHEEVARFLGGRRPVSIVAPPAQKTFDLSIVVPVEDMTEPAGPSGGGEAATPEERSSIWPAVDERLVEELRNPRNRLDVLAELVVSMLWMEDLTLDDIERVVARAAPFADLPRAALEATLDMLAGRYPSDEFAELRARINWDRAEGTLQARPGSQRLAVTSGGTIPDRGLFGVYLAAERSPRIGELDEEMVYESRVGDVFV